MPNNPAARTSSQGSAGSTASQESAGIGADLDRTPSSNLDGPPNLTPEGFGLDSTIKVYDAIVYLIYCPEHDKVAVTNVRRARVVWLPFVYLPEGVTWMKASQEGVAQIISQRDKEMEAEKAARMAPVFEMQCLNVLRFQTAEKFITRLANLVILRKSPASDFKCCTPSPRINWLRATDVVHDRILKVWGPELKNFLKMMGAVNNGAEGGGGGAGNGAGGGALHHHETVLTEYSLANAQHYLQLTDSPEQKLLAAAHVKAEHVAEIYESYVEHCYPAFSMCFESFMHYMALYGGYAKTDPALKYLFGAAMLYGHDYINFHEMLLCLVTLEPTTPNGLEARLKFVFRYYDSRGKGAMTMDELICMVQEMMQLEAGAGAGAGSKEGGGGGGGGGGGSSPADDQKELKAKIEEVVRCVGLSASQEVSEANFIKAVQTGRLKGTEKLCRSPKPILPQISKLIRGKLIEGKSKRDQTAGGASSKDATFLANRPKTKGTCYRCQAPNYAYRLHCVTLDTGGRCVEPRIINDQWITPCPPNEMNEHRYSTEYVFGNNSMPNIIAELVRNFYFSSQAAAAAAAAAANVDAGATAAKPVPLGLMTSKDDWNVFAKYTHMLCEAMKGLLLNEDKLLKVNAPALVLGDLQGNLHDLFVLEKHFWQSAPAIATNVLFLGNYTGLLAHGVECLAYLFSLKLIAPNKFFLLRGSQEMRSANRKALLKECTAKYGKKIGGNVYDMVNQVFELLPLAAVVDETVLCVHSGIPKSMKLGKLNELKKDIDSAEKEAPLAYELLVNQPVGIDDSLKSSTSQFKEAVLKQNKASGNALGSNINSFTKKAASAAASAAASVAAASAAASAAAGGSGHLKKVKSAISTTSTIEVSGFTPSDHFPNAFTFDETAFGNFCRAGGFSHVIRSQNLALPDGFDLRFNNRLLTVFSCSNYLQHYAAVVGGAKPEVAKKEPPNLATAVFIDGSNARLRLLSFDTSGQLVPASAPPPGKD